VLLYLIVLLLWHALLSLHALYYYRTIKKILLNTFLNFNLFNNQNRKEKKMYNYFWKKILLSKQFGIFWFRPNVAEETIYCLKLIAFFTIAKENLQREFSANKSNAGTGNCHWHAIKTKGITMVSEVLSEKYVACTCSIVPL